MEYEDKKTKPESSRKFLVQQVEEQSSLCDVTLKIGHWEKRFHRCMLVISPFFDHVLHDNFLEKTTGSVEMAIGTPVTIEMAIMYLYGKKPKLTQENIEHMLDLAEFLLMPTLKSTCINWLKSVSITEDNCMKYLRLSSIFNFEIPKCEQYIMAHLSEMLQHPEMENLTKDSVQYLFTDRKLSYVSADDKLRFLIRWKDARLASRRTNFRELLQLIDLGDVRKETLDELKAIQFVKEDSDIDTVSLDADTNVNRNCRVLIMQGESRGGTLWCLDLDRKKWFRLSPVAFVTETSYHYRGIAGSRNNNSEIYFTHRGYLQHNILVLNLQENVCKTYRLVDDTGNGFRDIEGVCISGDYCIGHVNTRTETTTQRRSQDEPLNIEHRLHMMSLFGLSPMERIVALKMIENEVSSTYIDISTLYIGRMQDEDIHMVPLLSFKNEKITQLCMNKMLTVAIIFGSRKSVVLYDLVDYTLEKMEIAIQYGDKLVQSDEGFIIYNNKRGISIVRITGPSLSSKFLRKEVSFENQVHCDSLCEIKYMFCGNTWYRYYRKSYKDHFMLARASHDELLTTKSIQGEMWQTLPLPKEDSTCYSSTIDDNICEIYLPKSMLRCDIECPHCKLITEGTRLRSVHVDADTSDSSYDDSDDDYYGHVYYGYDSDLDLYYD